MKSNLLYIIGGIVLFAGIIFFLIGFSVVGFDLKKLNTTSEYTEKIFESTEDVSLINAEDENTIINIVSSNDENVHITYFENTKIKYIITEENGVINLSIENDHLWTDDIFNFNFQDNTLTIEVPRNYEGDLQIKTSNAQISVNDIKANNITLNTSNNKIILKNLVSSGNVNLDTSNGSIILDKLLVDGDLLSFTSNSKVEANEIQAENIEIETKNGKIEVDGIFAVAGIDLKTSNSSIDFRDLEFSTNFICKTSNGSIDGMLKGFMADYSIISDTSNGNNNLPENMRNSDNRRSINIKTSNGHIDVDFEN